FVFFFFSSRRRHTRSDRDWSSDVCSSDLRRGATSLRWLRALLDHGVEVHGQVVVCPGINDGDVLDDTLAGVLDLYPELTSLAVEIGRASCRERGELWGGAVAVEQEREWRR